MLLLPLCGFSQTEIIEKVYKLSYYDNNNCIVYNYDFSVPEIRGNDTINDRISKIAKSYWNQFHEDNSSPEFYPRNEDCDGVSMNPASVSFNYVTGLNTKDFLSIILNVNYSAGGGGHGRGQDVYFFNVDSTNQLITIDSLFSPPNKKKLLKIAKEQFDIQMNITFDSFGDFIRYEGYHLRDTDLIIYYNAFAANNIIYEVSVPFNRIKDLINKKYRSLLK